MAFQGDWRVQAVHKTFNLIVGQELAETAYDADGNPITVTQTKEGSEEKIQVETTTNKIQPSTDPVKYQDLHHEHSEQIFL